MSQSQTQVRVSDPRIKDSELCSQEDSVAGHRCLKQSSQLKFRIFDPHQLLALML